MKHLQKYDEFVNEGFKHWMATFLMLANMGLVPLSVKASGDDAKRNFIQNLPQDQVDGAKFIDFLNKGSFTDMNSAWTQFISKNPDVKTSFEKIEKYVNKDGKTYHFNKKYVKHDYSNADIYKFTPTNWLTDMGGFVEDSLEPNINNFISEYEKLTSVEIGIVTIPKLGEYDVIDDYALETANRLGVGKKGANNGILIVLSMEDRKWSIQTGYGMEGLLPDITCWRIGDDVMKPKFKEGDYYGGIMDALNAIKKELGTESIETKKKWLAEKERQDSIARQEAWNTFLEVLMYIVLIGGVLGVSIYAIKKRKDAIDQVKDFVDRVNKIKNVMKSKNIKSQKLEKLFNDFQSIISEIEKSGLTKTDLTKWPNEKTLQNLESYLVSLGESYQKYDRYLGRIGQTLDSLKSDMSFFNQLPSVVKSTLQKYEELKSEGFDVREPRNLTTENIVKLEGMLQNIYTLCGDDMDNAISQYETLFSNISKIKGDIESVSDEADKVSKAKWKVKNWKDVIENARSSRWRKYADSSDERDLQKMITQLASVISTLGLFEAVRQIDKVVSFINGVIDAGEREERRKREEEEEEERRRRRQRESSYSSGGYGSSSSSSGSSFGGFGGGSFGGGGSSGGW